MYVCNATRAGITNIAPIAHAGGPNKVVRAVIFCAAEEASEDPTDRYQAIEPAERLMTWFRNRQVDCTVEYQPTFHENPGHWANCLRRLTQEGVPVIYNASGGRTLTKIGALWFPLANMSVVATEGKPIQTQMIQELDGRPTLVTPARHGEVGLADYLEISGLREPDETVRKARQRTYYRFKGCIEDFGSGLIASGPDPIRRLNGRLLPLSSGNEWPADVSLPEAIYDLLRPLNGYPGVRLNDKARVATFADQASAQFASGTWLEALIYNQLRDAFPNHGVACGVNLPGGVGEIDVAMMIRGQLHAIEAKTSDFRAKDQVGNSVRFGKENKRKAVDQIIRLRHNLLGQFGHAWIVNPASNPNEVGPMRTQSGATVLVGPKALSDLIDDIMKLVERSERTLAA